MRLKFLLAGLFLLVLIGLNGVPAPVARAAGSAELSTLRIMVWPEYDDPRVLVQFEGDLADTTSLPRDMVFYVPTTAKLYATAYADDNGQLVNTEPAKIEQADGGFLRVTIAMSKPRFHVEYYDDLLPVTADKVMDFVYRAAWLADKVSLEIQQPIKAENFATTPAADSQTSGYHDFKYFVFNFANVQADQTLKVHVSYTKSDPSPSISNLPQTDTAAADAQAPASNTPLLVTVGTGLLALSALLVLAWYVRRRPQLARADVPAHAASKAGRKFAHPAAGAQFCPQCGHSLSAADHFCANCGAKRRG